MKGVPENLVIIGKGKNKKKLEKLAKDLEMENVIFPDFVNDSKLEAYLKLSRAFILPSINRSEAFGVSLLEASFFAKPMISTELSTGTSFVNLHDETGLVVPPKDVKALNRAIIKFSKNDQLCRQYGRNAKDRYYKKFLPENTQRNYIQLYEEIIS